MNRSPLHDDLHLSYNLLFQKPLYDYAMVDEGEKQINVLILGNGAVGEQVFKAVFWCGQMLNTNLQITVASKNAKDFETKLIGRYEIGEVGSMPGLKDFSDYADLSFVNMSFPKELSGLNILDKKYNYIVIALGDDKLNLEVAGLIKNQIDHVNYRVLINYVVKSQENSVFCDAINNSSNVCMNPFGTGVLSDEINVFFNELYRIGFNIHYSYALISDQTASKKEQSKIFKSKEKGYDRYSSLAAALHIKYKLNSCDILVGDNLLDSLDNLVKIINDNGKTYNDLVNLEHRRWNAYMVTLGYRCPTENELMSFAYKNGNDHRDKLNKLHPCMVRCDNSGLPLNDYNEENWHKKSLDDEGLSELDKQSLRLYRIACKESESVIEKNQISSLFPCFDAVSESLKTAAKMLYNDENNAHVMWEKAYKEALQTKPGDKNQLEEINKKMSILKIRNKKTDYKKIDAVFVNMMPFCIWFQKKYQTVLTFSEGRLLEDVAVPTILLPETAAFIGENVVADSNLLKRYFDGRGGNTSVITEKCPHVYNCEEAKKTVNDCLDKYSDCIINMVGTNKYITAAIALIANDRGVPVVEYDKHQGIQSLFNCPSIHSTVHEKNLTCKEVVRLLRGDVSDAHNVKLYAADYNNLVEIFWKYSENWTTIIGSLSNNNPIAVPLKISKPESTVHEEVSITLEEADKKNAVPFLKNLQRYNIIGNLHVAVDDANHCNIDYDALNSEIKDFLTSPEISHLHLSNNNICRARLSVNICHLSDSTLLNFLEDAQSLNLINTLTVENKKNNQEWDVSFNFKNFIIRRFFTTEGDALEMSLYFETKNTGLFYEVQNSLNFYWDAERYHKSSDAEVGKKKIGQVLGYSRFRNSYHTRNYVSDVNYTLHNEIDVVLINGFQPVFISCKSSRNFENNNYLTEIKYLSDKFCGYPVLATVKRKEQVIPAYLHRAKEMGVSILTKDVITDNMLLREQLKAITEGKIIGGNEQ